VFKNAKSLVEKKKPASPKVKIGVYWLLKALVGFLGLGVNYKVVRHKIWRQMKKKFIENGLSYGILSQKQCLRVEAEGGYKTNYRRRYAAP
jgi:hypothetical protein